MKYTNHMAGKQKNNPMGKKYKTGKGSTTILAHAKETSGQRQRKLMIGSPKRSHTDARGIKSYVQ